MPAELTSEQRELIIQALKRLHAESWQESREKAAEEKVIYDRVEKQRATFEEPAPGFEELSEEEKEQRAEQIAIDSISTSKEPKLKQQSDQARQKFIVELIKQFDERGWSLPVNIHVIGPIMSDRVTEHDTNRYKLIRDIAKWAKEGTNLM
jgi:hypothetical protein